VCDVKSEERWIEKMYRYCKEEASDLWGGICVCDLVGFVCSYLWRYSVSFDIQKLSLRATLWLVWLNFLMASFLSFSHPFAMASSLTILKLTEVMALPHITFRPEDC